MESSLLSPAEVKTSETVSVGNSTAASSTRTTNGRSAASIWSFLMRFTFIGPKSVDNVTSVLLVSFNEAIASTTLLSSTA
eukprot:Skav220665  [mRNA]  locus=scaffold1057:83436:83675:+ [translate_table: standard]